MTSYTSEIAVGISIATLGIAAHMLSQQQALVAQLSQISPIREDQAASALYAKAWGKPWPQSKGTISKTEISGESGSVDDDEDVVDALADKLKVPPHFNYRYFKEIQGLKSALGASPGRDFQDVLVVREDYETLRQVLEDQRQEGYHAFVVTGHPGIGSYESWFSSLESNADFSPMLRQDYLSLLPSFISS
jgi:hypothetical protein